MRKAAEGSGEVRRLVPIRGSAVCRKVAGGERLSDAGGLRTKVVKVDLYEVMALPVVSPEGDCPFKAGDIVMSNSTGDEIEINPGETVYLFRLENLMCRVHGGEEG